MNTTKITPCNKAARIIYLANIEVEYRNQVSHCRKLVKAGMRSEAWCTLERCAQLWKLMRDMATDNDIQSAA